MCAMEFHSRVFTSSILRVLSVCDLLVATTRREDEKLKSNQIIYDVFYNELLLMESLFL